MRAFGIIAILSLLLTLVGCAKPEFSQANLVINPGQVVAGESCTISIAVSNTGKASGTCPVILKLDGAESNKQEVTVGPGETSNVSFTVTGEKPGVVSIDVNGVTGNLKVLKPAEFKLENLAVSPGQVRLDQEAKITVDVKNNGEVKGTYRAVLKADGVEAGSQEISIEPAATGNIAFTLARKQPGMYAIDVNGLTGTLKVLKPADIRTSNLTVSPAEVTAGSAATVTVTVNNSGEVSGESNLTLTCDGKSLDSKKVTVNGGATESVSFSVSREETGIYPISVGSLAGTLRVTGDTFPVLRKGDRWTYNHTIEGVNYKRIETVVGEEVITGKDCYTLKVEWAPLFVGYVSEMQYQVEKQSRERLGTSFSYVTGGQTINFVYVSQITRSGASPWRLFVGNEWREQESQLQKYGTAQNPTTKTVLMDTVFKIEAIETITVPAGTFKCFKIGFYFPNGTKFEENWFSVEAKNWIKMKSLVGDESFELFAHSVK